MKKLVKLISLFTSSQKRGLVYLLFLLLLAMIVEVFSIGSILPMISIFSSEDNIEKFPIFIYIINFIGEPTIEAIFLLVFIFLSIIFFFRSILLAFVAYYQNTYTFGIYKYFSKNLFSKYLYLSYEDHIQRNSAEMIRNLSTEVNLFSEVVRAYVSVFAEIIVLTGILLLLFFIDPFSLSIITICFLLVCIPYFLVLKNYINHWGHLRHFHDGKKTQWINEALSNIKYVLSSQKRASFTSGFSNNINLAARNARNQKVFQEIPRLLLEFVGVLSLAIMTATLFFRGMVISEMLSIITIFALAAFRIMPSVNRIIIAMQTFRYADPIINMMFDELQNYHISSIDNTKSYQENIIPYIDKMQFQNITYSYPLSREMQLKDISLTISQGQFIGIIGKSGSGKSTFLNILLGLLNRNSGEIIINDKIVNTKDSWSSSIGYVPQDIVLFDQPLKNNIAFGLMDKDINIPRINQVIDMANLNEVVAALDGGIDTMLGEKGVKLSGGQIQRIGIARALYDDPSIIVFDEATSALDRQTELEVLGAINALKGVKTMIMITHRIDTVKRCDYVYKFSDGLILEEGLPSEINLE